MTHTQAVVFVAMTLLIAFLYGVILWTREGQMDRLATDLESLERTVGLMLGRENNRGEYVPEDEWAPRAMEQPRLIGFSEAYPALSPADKPDDDTGPISPETVPDMKAASSVAPLPVVDDAWEARRAEIEAEFRRAAAEIGGA